MRIPDHLGQELGSFANLDGTKFDPYVVSYVCVVGKTTHIADARHQALNDARSIV